MVGLTLVDIREHIEALATEGGQYYVVCGRTGDRPVLRRYDPQVPSYDLIVCEERARDATVAHPRESTTETPQSRRSESIRTDSTPPERRELVESYARSARGSRLPVLPLTLELCRHRTTRLPQSVRVTPVDDGWQLTFVLADAVDQHGLLTAPIDEAV
jgi:hypothetical protein